MEERFAVIAGRIALGLMALGAPVVATAQPDSARLPLPAHGDPARTTFAAELGIDLAKMQKLPAGVYVRDVEVGRGALAAPGREVTVSYVAYLPDGTEVERTVPTDPPVRFLVGDRRVIRGWDTGLRGMRAGGTRVLVVPARLAYGADGKEKVPPNAVMVFVIALDAVR